MRRGGQHRGHPAPAVQRQLILMDIFGLDGKENVSVEFCEIVDEDLVEVII